MPAAREAFQYMVLRWVPQVEREEFLNVGVVLFCRRLRFLEASIAFDPVRARALAPGVPFERALEHLAGLAAVAAGDASAGALGRLPASERFGWLAAPSSTTVQSSPAHSGLCTDPSATLERLLRQLVLSPHEPPENASRALD